jgi:hypothetical protein
MSATPRPAPSRAEAKAIEPRCCVCTGAHQESRCPRLVVPDAMRSRQPNGLCRWCWTKLGEAQMYFHEDCAAAAEGRL